MLFSGRIPSWAPAPIASFVPPGSGRLFRSSGARSSGRAPSPSLPQPVRAPPARQAVAPVPPARSRPAAAAAARGPAPRRSDAPGAAPHRGGQAGRERASEAAPPGPALRRPRIDRRGAEGAGRCGPPEPCPPEVGARGWPCRRAEASGSGARREGCELRAGPRRTCAGSGEDGERGAVGARRFCAVGALGSAAPVSPVERHRLGAWRLAPLLPRPPGDERCEVVCGSGVVVMTASARVAFVASARVFRLCVRWERLQSLRGPKLEVEQRLLLFRFNYGLWQLKNRRCKVKHNKKDIYVSIGGFFPEKKKNHKNDNSNHSSVISALKKDCEQYILQTNKFLDTGIRPACLPRISLRPDVLSTAHMDLLFHLLGSFLVAKRAPCTWKALCGCCKAVSTLWLEGPSSYSITPILGINNKWC